MFTLRTTHTAGLTRAERTEIRSLLDDAFEGDFSDTDWAHTLGGLHVLAHDDDDGTLLAHGAVVQRHAVHDGRTLRVGYVEAVAVRADKRRRMIGTLVMDILEQSIFEVFDIGALSASNDGAKLYIARGWRQWAGPFAAYGPRGIVRLPDEEPPYLLLARTLDPAHELLFDWRDGDVL